MLKTKDKSIGESVAGKEDQFFGVLTESDLIKAYNWYSYFCDRADVQKFLKSYLDEKRYKKISSIKDAWRIPNTLGWIARLKMNGCEVPETTEKWFEDTITEVISKYAVTQRKKVVKKAVNKPDIQARTREASSEQIAQFESELDLFYENYKTEFSPYDYYVENEVAAIHATRVAEFYKPVLQELNEIAKDDQLKEAYSYLTAAQKKAEIKFLQLIIDDSTRWADNKKKSRKPRKKKSIPAAKAVSKVNYLEEYPDMKLVSENPIKIVGASQVWLYNTTSNQLIVYNAMKPEGLQVLRSTIKDFDPETSTAKRIGGEKQGMKILGRLQKGGKVVLRKLMSEIKTQDIEVAGRISKTMVIVKVVK